MNKIFSEQSDWDELLDYISDKQVTPIIGKEMYKFKKDGLLIPFDQYLSGQILNSYQVTDQPGLALSKAVDYLVITKGIKMMDIIRKLKLMVKDINFEFPLLTDFLGIKDLKYFINTAIYNNVLENNISKISNQTPDSINFSINEPFSDSDDLERLQLPFVFNVFGSLLNTVDPALRDEDMLEFTSQFNEKMGDAKAINLISALKNKNLLFLGCAFPDWMVRFILRLLSNQPMHDWGSRRTIIVVNDMSDVRKKQYDFLKNYDVTIYEGDTTQLDRKSTR